MCSEIGSPGLRALCTTLPPLKQLETLTLDFQMCSRIGQTGLLTQTHTHTPNFRVHPLLFVFAASIASRHRCSRLVPTSDHCVVKLETRRHLISDNMARHERWRCMRVLRNFERTHIRSVLVLAKGIASLKNLRVLGLDFGGGEVLSKVLGRLLPGCCD